MRIEIKKLLIFFFCIFLIPFFYAQKVTEPISTTNVDFIKYNYKIGLELLLQEKFKEARVKISTGLEASKKLKNKNLMGFGYQYLSDCYNQQKNYQLATLNLKESLHIFTDLNIEKEIYNCNFKLGRLYFKISEYDKSLESYFISLKIAEQNKNELQVAGNLQNIGEVYLLTPDLKTARINFNKALVIYKKLNNEEGIIGSLTNLGASYQKEGSRNNNEALVIKAIELFKEGLERARKDGFKRNESIFLGNIGSSFRRLKKYDESLEYLFKALQLKIELKRFSSAAHSCNDISETYLEINNLVKAKEYALKAVEYSKELNIHQERYASYLLSKIEYRTRNFKNAYNYLKKYHQIDDSLFSIKKITKINDLKIKYETEKKNLKIEAQQSNIALLASKNQNKNQWLFFGGIGLLSVLLITILSYSRNNAKKEKARQEKFSHELLQSQEDERTRIARELHDSVGQQLTLIKQKSQNLQQDEITILTNNALDEVRSISRGLYPALLKELGLSESIEQLINDFDEQTNLFFSMDIDAINSCFTESISLNFYRLIQECLTNIVKHAKAKSVTISIKREANTILTLISDNGKGFDINDGKKKYSLGLKTISERIRIMDGNLSIDSKLGSGTSFIFSIPIKK
ncbi:Histidine kinase-, DNA gyrase B-, and HSP90-like ATPase [Polaribacter sp. KT25b]|uniref:tetratricopeptide repeat-containing sensor histidine kinase n=1 Tax=Polaribacter sp. KT25b TaxID=1855336 RepID=UPI00087B02CB|nr:sensor histidine kinase [Polaribacter sp. KT25b]SDR69163.1 Histidine kinase-, DNA gyrase B-, and HSP90-like ATPase [Polaribacter sp. KT25b]